MTDKMTSLHITLTETEKVRLTQLAADANLSVSGYILNITLGSQKKKPGRRSKTIMLAEMFQQAINDKKFHGLLIKRFNIKFLNGSGYYLFLHYYRQCKPRQILLGRNYHEARDTLQIRINHLHNRSRKIVAEFVGTMGESDLPECMICGDSKACPYCTGSGICSHCNAHHGQQAQCEYCDYSGECTACCGQDKCPHCKHEEK